MKPKWKWNGNREKMAWEMKSGKHTYRVTLYSISKYEHCNKFSTVALGQAWHNNRELCYWFGGSVQYHMRELPNMYPKKKKKFTGNA